MKQPDRMLTAIVVGIIVLVVAALAMVLLRPAPTYRSDDSAEATAHNYLLALQQENYERAYTYLSPQLAHYPQLFDDFVNQVGSFNPYGVSGGETTLTVVSSRGTDTARIVLVQETYFFGGGLFDNGQSISSFEMRLDRQNGQWRLVDSDRYFNGCWSRADLSCPSTRP